jgi:hypothetical protein
MKLDPLKVTLLAEAKGLGANCALAEAAATTNAVICDLYRGRPVTMRLSKRLAAALGVQETEIVSSDAEYAVNLERLREWRANGCPNLPSLVAAVVS